MSLRIVGVLLDSLTADPGTPEDGEIWYRSDLNTLRGRINGISQNLIDQTQFDVHVNDAANPHVTTLELARTAGAAMAGAFSMAGFAINNVGGTVGTDAANRQFVVDQVNSKLQGWDWQESVLDRNLYIPPVGPALGDRYIVNQNSLAITAVDTGLETFKVTGDITAELIATDTFTVTGSTGNNGTYTVASVAFGAGETTITVNEDITDATVDGNVNYSSGAWNNRFNDIAEWDGAAWVFSVPNEGFATLVEDENILVLFNGIAWGAFGSAVQHGDLLGLINDDHTQYLLVDGTRAMTGALNMGTFNITNVGTVDGVTVSAHAARHEQAGADAIALEDLGNGGTNKDTFESDGAGGTLILKNTQITSSPGVNDDNTAGYAIGSRWWNTTTDQEFVALDVGTGVAVWIETTQAGGSSSTKAGRVVVGSFAGNPKTATVTLTTPFGTANYAVVLNAVTQNGKSFAPSVESQVAGSFIINMGANNVTDLLQTNWIATPDANA